MAFAYLKYLLLARNEHGVHSPFVFDLLTKVIYDKRKYAEYNQVEALRSELLKDMSELEVSDLGAGSNVLKSEKRKVSDIARYSLKPAKYGQLLFRLVKHFKPDTVLELGTSLGLSACYLKLGMSDSNMISIEGSEEIANRAEQEFVKMGVSGISLLRGNFDEVLPGVLEDLKELDFVFFDGNHRREPTLKYFELCLKCVRPDSVFIFDDIHWSDEMEQAWVRIKAHPSVRVTVDLFFMGLVFFRAEMSREDFVLRY